MHNFLIKNCVIYIFFLLSFCSIFADTKNKNPFNEIVLPKLNMTEENFKSMIDSELKNSKIKNIKQPYLMIYGDVFLLGKKILLCQELKELKLNSLFCTLGDINIQIKNLSYKSGIIYLEVILPDDNQFNNPKIVKINNQLDKNWDIYKRIDFENKFELSKEFTPITYFEVSKYTDNKKIIEKYLIFIFNPTDFSKN